jgi:hypothetical protein
MDTAQLTSLARTCSTTMRYFRGVYASDTLPHRAIANSTYICNLDTSDEPGSHWISFYVPSDRSRSVEYFDPYGLPPPTYFNSFLSRGHSKDYFLYNSRTIQHLSSAVCGQYALYYIWQRPIASSMDNVLRVFDSTDHLYNDLLVNCLVENHFSVDLDVFDDVTINQYSLPRVYR